MAIYLDILLDIFIFLELNEVEKCQAVCKYWKNIIFNKKSFLCQKRRIFNFKLKTIAVKKGHNWGTYVKKFFTTFRKILLGERCQHKISRLSRDNAKIQRLHERYKIFWINGFVFYWKSRYCWDFAHTTAFNIFRWRVYLKNERIFKRQKSSCEYNLRKRLKNSGGNKKSWRVSKNFFKIYYKIFYFFIKFILFFQNRFRNSQRPISVYPFSGKPLYAFEGEIYPGWNQSPKIRKPPTIHVRIRRPCQKVQQKLPHFKEGLMQVR